MGALVVEAGPLCIPGLGASGLNLLLPAVSYAFFAPARASGAVREGCQLKKSFYTIE